MVERYPELKADKIFRGLMSELAETENKIAKERASYNEAVRVYNGMIREWPEVGVAKLASVLGFHDFRSKPYFQAAPEAQIAPRVKL